MRSKIFDQFTYLHFASGIISYFWGISFILLLIIHTIYEYLETTQFGIYIINNYFGKIWPGGGKHKSEGLNNAIGDTIGAIFGWISAYYLDNLGNKYQWYSLHIK